MRYSKILKKHYSVKIDGGVWFEDDVDYTRDEIRILKGVHDNVLESVHNCKSVFKGWRVVDCEWTI